MEDDEEAIQVDNSLHVSQEIPVTLEQRTLGKNSSWMGFKRNVSEKFIQISLKTVQLRKNILHPWDSLRRKTDVHELVKGYQK